MKIGLIGTGSIGKSIADAVAAGDIKKSSIQIIGDIIDTLNLREMARVNQCTYTIDIHDFLKVPLDLVVEAASQKAVLEYSELFLSRGISMMIMSVGALAEEGFYDRLLNLSEHNDCSIYIPSGAIGALDILKAAKIAGINSVTLTTRKPPESLGIGQCTSSSVIYEGKAREAVKLFPKNVNVAMILSLAGIGEDKTNVRVIADPGIDKNIHEIEVIGAFGEYRLQVANVPMPNNPKTSYLASLSAIALLKSLAEKVHIGT